MNVEALTLYPVKGLRGLPLTEAHVDRCGLRGDRRWAITRPDGRVFTQRDLPAMARIDAWYENDMIRLEAAGHGGADARPVDDPAIAEVWGTSVPMRAATPAASAWLAKVLGAPCTLAYMADPNARVVTPDLARPGDVVSLADGFPLLITNLASLANLNCRLASAVPMERFRPNLAVGGAAAWTEDGWAHITAGPVRLRLASPCSRCKVITLDQRTGDNPARTEPLRTLGTFHRDAAGRITFGWNAIPERLGVIRVGDPVQAETPFILHQ